MSKGLISFVAAIVAAASVAHARPNTLNMTCGEAAATVARAGAIVLSTGEFTYDRFVATNGFCLPGEITRPGLAPTANSPQCQVGYICVQPYRFENDGF